MPETPESKETDKNFFKAHKKDIAILLNILPDERAVSPNKKADVLTEQTKILQEMGPTFDPIVKAQWQHVLSLTNYNGNPKTLSDRFYETLSKLKELKNEPESEQLEYLKKIQKDFGVKRDNLPFVMAMIGYGGEQIKRLTAQLPEQIAQVEERSNTSAGRFQVASVNGDTFAPLSTPAQNRGPTSREV